MSNIRNYAVACLLTKYEFGTYFTNCTLSITKAINVNEAKGNAVAYAMKVKPDFSISRIITLEIEKE